jgi:L-alanine-DL-glutamate epimerase-like enolase superfamily enzyme
MKITYVEAKVLVWPPMNPPFWMSLLPVNRPHELVVLVHTDEGLTGIGHSDQASSVFTVASDGNPRLANASRIVPDQFGPLLNGEDPARVEQLWQKMFATTYRHHWNREGWSRSSMLSAIAAVDMALWDLRGKAAGLPVFRLLGGTEAAVPMYVAGGYYRDGKGLNELSDETAKYTEHGYRALKMRVGGMSIDEDVARVATVREALAPGAKLMLDANEAYDSETAIRVAPLFDPFGVFWFEEPVAWYEGNDGLRRVAESTGIGVAGGEQAATHWEAEAMARDSGITYMEFDCMRTGGPTEWLRVADACRRVGVEMAPHHGAHIHAHLVSAAPNGLMVEAFPDPFMYNSAEELEFVRWDRKREMFSVHPEVRDGMMVMSEQPGWGIELDPEVIRKREVLE